MSKRVAWTNHQLKRLKETFATATREELEKSLAPHSWGTIVAKASKLKIHRRAEQRNWRAICAAHKPVFDFGRSVFK